MDIDFHGLRLRHVRRSWQRRLVSLGWTLGDALESLHCCFDGSGQGRELLPDFGRQTRARLDLTRDDADEEAFGKDTSQRPTEAQRFGESEAVRRHRGDGARVLEKLVEAEGPYGPRWRVLEDRVDEHRGLSGVEEIEHAHAGPAGKDDLGIASDGLRREQRSFIVASGPTPQRDHADGHPVSSRSTISSFRKCVAHEMHGS